MKPSRPRLPMLAWGLALLIAASGMLLSASGAQAASKRGAVLVKDISPGNPKRVGSSNPNGLTNVAGTLFFAAFDRQHGTELWRSDGTRRGTRMVKDINPNPPPKGFSSDPFALTAVGRTLYFVAKDGIHGEALWRSNGTARGTRMVKDINLAPGGDRFLGPPTDLAGTLFYVVGDQNQLWRSDGTKTGTTLVKQFIDLRNLTAVGGILYFAANGRWPVAKRRHGVRDGANQETGLLRLAHRRRRHPLLHRRRRHPRRAVAKRWHRGGNDPGQAVGRATSQRPDGRRRDPLLHHW